ncbi:MAG: glucose-1-phosphate cytidylyltransferase [Acidobacteriota bacterium]
MKVALLAGGAGTRLAEETEIRPKPMVEIGGRPILWHIMQHYSHFGFEDFIVALGYKGEYIKKYFLDFHALHSDLRIDLSTGETELEGARSPQWKVQLVDTGLSTLTGGRIKRLQHLIGDERFMLTWGDGLSDLDLRRLLDFHESHGKLATLTAVRPPARYGYMTFDGERVDRFTEKPQLGEGWINGAFFVLEPGIFDYIGGDEVQWEAGPLERLARDGELMAFKHQGFWQCMDTLRERYILERLWERDDCPWRLWS